MERKKQLPPKKNIPKPKVKTDADANIFKRVIKKLDSIPIGIGKERDYFVENLSMLSASGMTVLSAIDSIETEVKSRSMKYILANLREDIESGSPLWKALQKTKVFPDHVVSLVRIGEESGKLSQNLKLVAEQEQKSRSFKSKIRSAMMYPLFVLVLTLVIGVLIAWFILPRLAVVFGQLNIELPLLTRMLIRAGTFLGEYGYIAFPIFFLVIGVLLFFVFGYSKTKFIGHAILFSIPGVKTLFKEVELARFGYLLGTLLQAGIPITYALDSVHKATTFNRYKFLYAHLRDSINEGNSFQKSFALYKKANKLIPVPIQQLIIAGERSGRLSDILIKISDRFEEKTEDTTKNLSVILEPVLLVIVWLGVVGVALAVILPVYNLIGGFNSDPSSRIENTQPPPIVEEVVEDVQATTTESVVIKEVASTTLQIVEVGIEYLNVRDEPSTTGDIIERVFPGDVFEYIGTEDDWFKIVLEDDSGWVFGEYVQVLKIDD